MSAEILEILKQMSFLSSLLAGFSIAVAVELIVLEKKRTLVTSAMVVFLISSILSAAATFCFIMVLAGVIGPPGFPRPSENWIIHFVGGIGILPMLGLVLFLAGISLVGWIRSRLVGIITSAVALLGIS